VLNFHTAFNIVASLFSAFAVCGLVAKLVTRLIPIRSDRGQLEPAPSRSERHRYALRGTRLRAARDAAHGRRVADMNAARRSWCSRNPIRKLVKEVEKADNGVDLLHEAIKLYLVKVVRSRR